MRKAKVFAAVGIMAMSLFSGLAFNVTDAKADETVGVTLDSVKVMEDELGDDREVTVNVTVNSNPGTILSQTEFTYDSSVLTVTKVEAKDFFKCDATEGQTSDYTAPNLEKNPIQLIDGYGAVRGNSDATGVMYTITLKIAEDAKAGTEATIGFSGKFMDSDLNEYDVVCEDAKVAVVEKETETPTPPTPPTPEKPTPEKPTPAAPTTAAPTPAAPTTATPATTKANQAPRTGDVAPVAVLGIMIAATATVAVLAKKKVED